MFSALLIISLISLVLFLYSRRKYYMSSWNIGGPLGYPILGIGLVFCCREKIINYLSTCRNKYGPVFHTFLGLVPVLFVSDPVEAEKVLTSTVCINKSFIYHGLKKAVGNGLLTSDYLRWSRHRKLLNPTFNHKILVSFYPIINREAKTLVNVLSKYIGKGPAYIAPLLQNCALATTCETTMGKQTNLQTGENLYIIETYNSVIKYTSKRIFTPWYVSDFLFQFFAIKKEFDKVVTIARKFVADLIQEKVNRANKAIDNDITSNNIDDNYSISKTKYIFLDQVFKLMENNEFTAEDVNTESNSMVIAAFETTGAVMYNTLICLAMFPQYQEKVFEEILSIMPEKDTELTYDDTQQMVYLEMVIKESMRVLAPVPVIGRNCTEDFDFGNGIKIPKGTQVIVDIFNMQRCEKIWGPKAKTFDPDHFLKDNFAQVHPYSFIPFVKGLRNCIGWRYGMMALKVFLAHAIRSYNFTTDFKFKDLQFVEDLVIKYVESPLLEIHERNI